MRSLTKWNRAGRWTEFRPDMEKLNEYKAASLYIEKGLAAKQISQKLSTSETLVNLWIYVNGWNAAKLVRQSQNVVIEVVAAFCSHYKNTFPRDAAQIEVAQNSYLKKLTAKK